MPVVYVVNRSAHDYSDAERFGTLYYCTDGTMSRFDTSFMYRAITEAMHDSQSEDFILMTSLGALCGIACSIFALKHKQLHLLLYNGNNYVERSLFFHEDK